MIQRRISDSPEPAAPVNSGEPLNTMASAASALGGGLHLGDHVLEEQEAAVVDPGQAGAEAPVEARACRASLRIDVFDLLPLHPEGRIGEQVVEVLVRDGRPR